MHSPWRRSMLALGGRIVVLLLLTVALTMPARESQRKNIQATVLMDSSASSQTSSIRSRLLRELDETTQLTIRPVVTNLNHSIDDALWRFDPSAQGAIILASNGQWNQSVSKTLLKARNAKIPIFWLPVLENQDAADIRGIAAPNMARAGQRVGISVDVQPGHLNNPELVLLANKRPVARKGVIESGRIDFLLDLPESGPLILGAELHDAGNGHLVTKLEQGALINIATAPSVLLVSERPSAFGKSLRDGGWSVIELQPESFVAEMDRLRSVSSLVLDDVAATDLPAVAWTGIERAVRHDAMGLLVLGGPRSFGLGAYRDSLLESLLPVISEPPEDEAPASLIFLIDVSGSMDRPGAADSRLQIAKQAVVETARALRTVDQVGLMTFDVQTQELLPIDSRSDHASAIEQIWPQRASGGTVLMPSLQRASDALLKSDTEQKLLVLLTDGFLAKDDLQQLRELLRDTVIEIVVMIIGDSTQSDVSALAEITAANGGKTIRVDDVLRLPELMRNEVESRRPALVSESSRPRIMSSTAWLPHDTAWPEIDAYLLTRPREQAQVHLVSGRGDVLIASMTTGAGKVVTVTSGFSGWTEKWLQWNEWPSFAANMMGFLATRDTSDIEISVQQNSDGDAAMRISLQDTKLPDVISASLLWPSGKIDPVSLQPQSPGKLAADLELVDVGLYTIVIDDGSTTIRHRFLKLRSDQKPWVGPPIARTWLNDGLLQLWNPRSLRGLGPDTDRRNWLVGLALFFFLLVLVVERAILGSVFEKIRFRVNFDGAAAGRTGLTKTSL